MDNKVKIIMIGPQNTGKTTLSNFLSQTVEIGNNDYRPTKGCRIVEFEVPNVMVENSITQAEVELWDVSGDRRYDSCWPAVKQGTNGLIVVYNPGREDGSRLLETLLTNMSEDLGLSESQCLVFCHNKPGTSGRPLELPAAFRNVIQIESKLEENDNMIRTEFTKYISSIFAYMSALDRRQENFILQ